MPWVRALLRGQKVYARADAEGRLDAREGKVEVRYKPHDGRRYDARAQNLEVVEGATLPDETCGPAESTPAAKPGAAKGPAGARRGAGPSRAKAVRSPEAPAVPEGAIVAYTDGACSGNPGPAGLGVVLLDGARRTEISEYLGHGTNNIAELTAILRALAEVTDPARTAVVHTDSQYAIGVVQRGWKAKANVELVAELREALAGLPGARLVYVPGHSGVPLNERADELAREAVTARRTRRVVHE